MINLGYLGEARNLNLGDSVVKMLIVRKPVGEIPSDFIHFPMLSPTPNLLMDAQRWKKNEFNDSEINELNYLGIEFDSIEAWWVLYEPIFKEELKNRGDVEQGVRILKDRIDKGKKVYLFCYCKDLCRCHRVLVGKYLEEQGLKVNFRKDTKPEEENLENDFQLNMFA